MGFMAELIFIWCEGFGTEFVFIWFDGFKADLVYIWCDGFRTDGVRTSEVYKYSQREPDREAKLEY